MLTKRDAGNIVKQTKKGWQSFKKRREGTKRQLPKLKRRIFN